VGEEVCLLAGLNTAPPAWKQLAQQISEPREVRFALLHGKEGTLGERVYNTEHEVLCSHQRRKAFLRGVISDKSKEQYL
jgi:hypothetical protein